MIPLILADPIPLLPPPDSYQAVGWVCVMVLGLSGGVYYALLLMDRLKGKPQQPPNRALESTLNAVESRVVAIEKKLDGFISVEWAKENYATIYVRLNKGEKDIADVWTTMRLEDAATRDTMHRYFQEIERALGRIEGAIKH
jgi:hypothetical protein